jgi:hypothetical protein
MKTKKEILMKKEWEKFVILCKEKKIEPPCYKDYCDWQKYCIKHKKEQERSRKK